MSLSTTLTERAAVFLDNTTNRRGFLNRAAMAGSAVAAAGVTYATRPTSAYAAVCGCNGRTCNCTDLCCDGYTEFCCQIYGNNSCPPDTILAGWWKVDNSSFCAGAARYYMDCNKTSPGCGCGATGVCRGGTPCQCRSCGNRKDGCTVFRYGNCNNHVSCVGPIMCRVVTCSKPWEIDPGCSTVARTDENTRWHHRECLTESDPVRGLYAYAVGQDGAVWQRQSGPSGHDWGAWTNLGGLVSGGIGAVGQRDRSDLFVVAGSSGDELFQRTWQGTWGAWRSLGRPAPVGLAATPAACVRDDGRRFDVFATGQDGSVWQRHWRASGGWSNWIGLGGTIVGGVQAVSLHDGRVDLFVVAGSGGDSLYQRTWEGSWGGWRRLGRPLSVGLAETPAACVRDGGRRLDVFATGQDGSVWQKFWQASRGWSGWIGLGGVVTAGLDAAAMTDGRIDLFAIAGSNADSLFQRTWQGSWSNWADRGHPASNGLTATPATTLR